MASWNQDYMPMARYGKLIHGHKQNNIILLNMNIFIDTFIAIV